MVGLKRMHVIAKAILPAAQKYNIDPVWMGALVLAESGGRNIVIYGRGRDKNGADVGAFQIHCPKASFACIQKYIDIRTASLKSTRMLARAKRLCQNPESKHAYRCRNGWLSWYNPGSNGWHIRVMNIYLHLKGSLNRG